MPRAGVIDPAVGWLLTPWWRHWDPFGGKMRMEPLAKYPYSQLVECPWTPCQTTPAEPDSWVSYSGPNSTTQDNPSPGASKHGMVKEARRLASRE